MADITMCSGKNCPMKETCYRYTAPVTEYRQSYFFNTPLVVYEDTDKPPTCSHYWEDVK